MQKPKLPWSANVATGTALHADSTTMHNDMCASCAPRGSLGIGTAATIPSRIACTGPSAIGAEDHGETCRVRQRQSGAPRRTFWQRGYVCVGISTGLVGRDATGGHAAGKNRWNRGCWLTGSSHILSTGRSIMCLPVEDITTFCEKILQTAREQSDGTRFFPHLTLPAARRNYAAVGT